MGAGTGHPDHGGHPGHLIAMLSQHLSQASVADGQSEFLPKYPSIRFENSVKLFALFEGGPQFEPEKHCFKRIEKLEPVHFD